MSAEPIDPVTASSPELEYDVIHLGGESAVVVPMSEYRRLRALERVATVEALEDAEDLAALEDWQARDAAGTTKYVSRDEAWRMLGLEP